MSAHLATRVTNAGMESIIAVQQFKEILFRAALALERAEHELREQNQRLGKAA